MLYLRSFNLIVSTQSGFQPQRSTESILIKMTDDWLDAIDQGLHTGAIFPDLRKAFNVVNRDLIVAKLQIHGCSPSSLLYFKSYLTDRRRCVDLKGTVSDTEVLAFGILQGSILGPAFSSFLSMTYRSPWKVGVAYLLMMPLSMPVPQLKLMFSYNCSEILIERRYGQKIMVW